MTNSQAKPLSLEELKNKVQNNIVTTTGNNTHSVEVKQKQDEVPVEETWPNNKGKYYPTFPELPPADTPQAVFKSHIPNIKYIFPNGKEANFILGKYSTNVPDEIKHLCAEIGGIGINNSKHPQLYLDENELETAAPKEPLEDLKARIRAELKAEMLAATNPSNNMGNTKKEELSGIVTSRNIIEATAGSTSAPTAPVISK